MVFHKNRYIAQWNAIKSPEIYGQPHVYGQVLFLKRAKNNQWGKFSFFSKL